MPILLKFYLFAAISLFIGLGSAWFMVEAGTFLTTTRAGAWETWHNEGTLDADPYTSARMARSGRLPVTTSTALYFTATRDDDGYELTSDCDYEISGRPINSLWWSIALYNTSGEIIDNKAERFSFNSQNISLQNDGAFRIRLASTVKPGNWLPSGEDNSLVLMLRLIRPLNTAEASGALRADILPQITRIGC